MTKNELEKWREVKNFNSDEKNDKWKSAHRKLFLDVEYPDEVL